MAKLTLRSTRDSALSWEEGDANLLALDSDSPWKVSENHITYDGKVGVGVDSTYSPVYDLDFGNGDSATVGITNGDLVVHVDGPNQLKVWNNTVQSITVKTTGKVGINDSDPSEMLTVGGNIRASNTILGNVISANSITDGYLTLSAGNVDNIQRLTVLDDTVKLEFGHLYSKTSGLKIEDFDSTLTSSPTVVPTSFAVSKTLGDLDSSVNTRLDSLSLTLQSQFDSFETQINADFDALELSLTNQIDSLDTSLNLKITNLINDQNEAFDSLELSLNTQINNLEISLQNQIDSLDTSLNLSITNLINDQNQAFDSLEGSINATLASYDLDGVLAVGNTSTRSMTIGALTSTTINTQNNAITAGTGTITSGALTATGASNLLHTAGASKARISADGVHFDDWIRSSTSGKGWYHTAGGGGWMMSDTTWIRAYGSKPVYVANQIAATGDVTAFYSDERLKEKVGTIDNALDAVESIETFLYKHNEIAKEHGYDDDKVHAGVSAQSVEKVLPEIVDLAPFDYETLEDGTVVSKSGEDYKTVKYDKLTVLLIEAVKELSARVKELESK